MQAGRYTIQFVVGTNTGPVRGRVDDLTEGGVAVQVERPLPEAGADWHLGCLEVGGERYLDVILGRVEGADDGHDHSLVLRFLEASFADTNGLVRLIGACSHQGLAA
jgi:hypothetical protein